MSQVAGCKTRRCSAIPAALRHSMLYHDVIMDHVVVIHSFFLLRTCDIRKERDRGG